MPHAACGDATGSLRQSPPDITRLTPAEVPLPNPRPASAGAGSLLRPALGPGDLLGAPARPHARTSARPHVRTKAPYLRGYSIGGPSLLLPGRRQGQQWNADAVPGACSERATSVVVVAGGVVSSGWGGSLSV